MRTFNNTHPWLRFSLDLRDIEHQTWMLLGEAVSKMEHIAGVPLNPDAAERLHEVYLAKGVLATTAIEGNTLTEDEVLDYLGGQLKLPPSREYLGREIGNVVDACNQIGRQVIAGRAGVLSSDDITEYNRRVLAGLPLPEGTVPGELRQHSVLVGRYRGAPAEDLEYLLERFCQWLNGLHYPQGFERHYAILAAMAAHLHFVWIHPFGDGNGRTARLIEFRFLLQAGFPTPAAHLLSNFYNLTRAEYYRQLDHASKSGGDLSGFIAYAVQGLVDQLREQLQLIRQLQWDTTWRNFVHERFGTRASAAQNRRRTLALALSKIDEDDGWVRISDIPELTTRLAQEFARKTSKTLTRDLNALAEMELILKRGRRVKANKDLILAFLPARATPGDEPEARPPA